MRRRPPIAPEPSGSVIHSRPATARSRRLVERSGAAVAAIVFVFLSALPAGADAPVDVRGTYSGQATNTGDASNAFVVQFTDENLSSGQVFGSELVGGTDFYALSGTVSGQQVTYTATSGTLKLTGQATVSPDGTLTGTQQTFSGPASTFTLAKETGAAADNAAASVDGEWQLTISVTDSKLNPSNATGFTGPAVGHTGTDTVRLTTTCAITCTVVMTSMPSGNAAFVTPNGLTGLNAEKLNRVGATMQYTTGGFGAGPCATPPPPFATQLALTVTAASREADGALHATALTGTERTVQLNCSGGLVTRTLTIERAVFVPAAATSSPSPAATSAAAPSSAPTTTTAATKRLDHITSGPAPIAQALPTAGQAFSTDAVIASAAVTLAFMLFITFPANWFNKTFEENYDDIVAAWRRRIGRPRRTGTSTSSAAADVPTSSEIWRRRTTYGVVVVLGALLGGLLNPRFGFNSATVEAVVATLICIAFGSVVGASVDTLYRRVRHHPVSWQVRALPAGLAIAAGCVVISRLSDFQPGYLYGIVAGVVFGGTLAKNESGHVVALSHLATLCVAVIAWFAWTPVNHAALHRGAAPPLVVFDDVLASIVVGALVGGVISLMPIRFMPGHTLASWHRGAWAAVFALSTFGLIDLVVRPQRANHAGHAPIVTAIVLFVFFGGGSWVFHEYFKRKKQRAESTEEAPASVPAPRLPAESDADPVPEA